MAEIDLELQKKSEEYQNIDQKLQETEKQYINE